MSPEGEPARLKQHRTARHMIVAVDYLIGVSSGVGFTKLSHLLERARSELVSLAGTTSSPTQRQRRQSKSGRA
jgi:hypothetical protein